MTYTKKLGLWILILSMALGLLACGPSTDEPDDGDNGEVTPPADEPKEVVVALGADARTLLAMEFIDWTTHVSISNIYDPILTREDDMSIVGHLATEWRILDDLTWEFDFREDVVFHNGEPFNAEAFKFTIEYILDEANQMAYRGRFSPISEIEILGEFSARVHTSEPMPILPVRLTSLYPLEPGYVTEVGHEEAASKPIGTGAYRLVEWSKEERIVLEAFDDHWQGRPSIDRLIIRPIPEFSTRVAALMAGEIHLIPDVPGHMYDVVNASAESEVRSVPSSRINYIALVNLKEGPMQDKRVRQAMNYAVNIPEIIEHVLDGHATQMAGCLSGLNEHYYPGLDPYPYDPDRAVELIREAGYEPSQLRLAFDSPSGRYPKDQEVAMAIAAQLGNIGIQVDVTINEWGTHLDKIINRETGDMFLLGWGPALEAQGTIESLMMTERTYSGFGLPWLDDMIREAVPVVDPDERYEAWAEIQRVVHDEAPWIFLWQQHDLYGVNHNLVWEPRADERIEGFLMDLTR